MNVNSCNVSVNSCNVSVNWSPNCILFWCGDGDGDDEGETERGRRREEGKEERDTIWSPNCIPFGVVMVMVMMKGRMNEGEGGRRKRRKGYNLVPKLYPFWCDDADDVNDGDGDDEGEN